MILNTIASFENKEIQFSLEELKKIDYQLQLINICEFMEKTLFYLEDFTLEKIGKKQYQEYKNMIGNLQIMIMEYQTKIMNNLIKKRKTKIKEFKNDK